MTAYLSLQSELGLGRPLAVEAALDALAAKGVVQGIDPKAVAEAVAACRAGKTILRKPVAAGRQARPAGAPRWLWLVGQDCPFAGPKPAGPSALSVAAGTQVLRLEAAGGSAEPGLDVLGRAVAPPPAQAGAGTAPAAETMPTHDASLRDDVDGAGSHVYTALKAGVLRI